MLVYGGEEKRTKMRNKNKILLYTKDYFKDGDLEYFPVYMAQFFYDTLISNWGLTFRFE